jgi:hypothetical protein
MGGFSPAKIFKPKPRPAAPIQKAAVKAAPAGPTIAEMQQGQIRRGRGRRATILTSSKGVDEDLTLGYKTLLG